MKIERKNCRFFHFVQILYNPEGRQQIIKGRVYTMKAIISAFLFVIFCCSFVFAQNRPDPNVPQGENLEVPEGWEVRLDRDMEDVVIGSDQKSSDIYFVNMTPGWHITTGPAAIFYHPENTASGNFQINSEVHFFDPGDRNREAYGVFLGGKNLDADNQTYVYFLIRNTGEFLLKKRIGDETELIQDWTPSSVIAKYEDGVTESASVKNIFSIDVSDDTVHFYLNGEEVASVDSSEIETDGIFGLRVNHSINLHISDLKLIE